jgi:hypothetical protein
MTRITKMTANAIVLMALSFLELSLNLHSVYERMIRKGIRYTTNLWIGESAYAPACFVGLTLNFTPDSLIFLPDLMGKSHYFNVIFSGCCIILLIKTIHVKPITFI